MLRLKKYEMVPFQFWAGELKLNNRRLLVSLSIKQRPASLAEVVGAFYHYENNGYFNMTEVFLLL